MQLLLLLLRFSFYKFNTPLPFGALAKRAGENCAHHKIECARAHIALARSIFLFLWPTGRSATSRQNEHHETRARETAEEKECVCVCWCAHGGNGMLWNFKIVPANSVSLSIVVGAAAVASNSVNSYAIPMQCTLPTSFCHVI